MQKPPLYRKVNTTAHGVHHRPGGDFRDERKSSSLEEEVEAGRSKMNSKTHRGLDYTPLFKFLLSKVGQNWNAVFSEAKARLDKTDPIYWLVAQHPQEQKDYVRVGESSYFSGLFIREDGTLQVVNPSIGSSSLLPECKCCTHTFNGKRFTRPFAGFPQG